jgi:ubiquinone/menaquinone biosynthesis C-methylase UbiE
MKLPGFLKRTHLEPGSSLTDDLRREIRQSFDEASQDEEHFPSTIDPRILHVQVLLRFFAPIGNHRLLDAGCGKGRYARILQEENPQARITGLDISERMLHNVPAGIHKVAGILTDLPFADQSFDGVYATESLEHAVDIERAVAELCRILRPGGKIAIIDKNADHWGKLKTPAWERWFNRRELEKLLARHCRTVRSGPISYWEDVAPDGLFLSWFAEK